MYFFIYLFFKLTNALHLAASTFASPELEANQQYAARTPGNLSSKETRNKNHPNIKKSSFRTQKRNLSTPQMLRSIPWHLSNCS